VRPSNNIKCQNSKLFRGRISGISLFVFHCDWLFNVKRFSRGIIIAGINNPDEI